MSMHYLSLLAYRLEVLARTGLPFDEEELEDAIDTIFGDMHAIDKAHNLIDSGEISRLSNTDREKLKTRIKAAKERIIDLKNPTGRGILKVSVNYSSKDKGIAAIVKTRDSIVMHIPYDGFDWISPATIVHELVHAFDPKVKPKEDAGRSTRREFRKPWSHRTHEQHAILKEIVYEVRETLQAREYSTASAVKLRFFARNPDILLNELAIDYPRDASFVKKLYRGIFDIIEEEIRLRIK